MAGFVPEATAGGECARAAGGLPCMERGGAGKEWRSPASRERVTLWALRRGPYFCAGDRISGAGPVGQRSPPRLGRGSGVRGHAGHIDH